jgi:hypothetical protein
MQPQPADPPPQPFGVGYRDADGGTMFEGPAVEFADRGGYNLQKATSRVGVLAVGERIRPVVHLLFACDAAERDAGTDRWILTNPWSTVALPPGATFPFRAEEFWVYAQFTGVIGEFELAVEMRHLVDNQSPRVVGWSPVARIVFPAGGRLLAIDTAFALRGVPFREPGVYEIRALADGDDPGSWAPLAGTTFELRVLDRRTVV